MDVGARFGVGQTGAGLVELFGYSLPSRLWQSGDAPPLTLFWRAEAPVTQDYQLLAHLLDTGGQPVAQSDGPPAAGQWPTSGWAVGETVVDRHGVLLEAGSQALSPGEYRLCLGLYLPATGERLAIAGGAGTGGGDSLFLGSVRLISSEGEQPLAGHACACM